VYLYLAMAKATKLKKLLVEGTPNGKYAFRTFKYSFF